jgi:hypothetical protein
MLRLSRASSEKCCDKECFYWLITQYSWLYNGWRYIQCGTKTWQFLKLNNTIKFRRIFVCCECCVLSGRGLCDGLITRPEESYRLWRVVVCDQETSKTRRLKPATGLWKYNHNGLWRQENKQTIFAIWCDSCNRWKTYYMRFYLKSTSLRCFPPFPHTVPVFLRLLITRHITSSRIFPVPSLFCAQLLGASTLRDEHFTSEACTPTEGKHMGQCAGHRT